VRSCCLLNLNIDFATRESRRLASAIPERKVPLTNSESQAGGPGVDLAQIDEDISSPSYVREADKEGHRACRAADGPREPSTPFGSAAGKRAFAGARVLPLALEIIEAPDEHSATALN
jgi:hypothetical protein